MDGGLLPIEIQRQCALIHNFVSELAFLSGTYQLLIYLLKKYFGCDTGLIYIMMKLFV